MAYAIRRLLLRTRTFRYRRAQLQLSDRPTITPASQVCRQFHASPFLFDDKPEPRKRGRPRKAKAAEADPKTEENNVVVQGQSAENETQLSVSSELGVDLGARELDPEFRKQVDQLTEEGDVAGLLELADAEFMSPQEHQELIQLVGKNMEVEDHADTLQKLAALVEHRPDDVDGAHELMKQVGMNPKNLFDHPSEDVAAAFRSDNKNINLNDPDALDRQFWKSMTGKEEFDEDDADQERIIRQLLDSGGSARDENLQRHLRRSVVEKQRNVEAHFGVDGRLDPDTKPDAPGFFNYEDPDAGEDGEFNQDDLPAKGHQELDLHREIREYARLAIWDLPLLSSELIDRGCATS
jgi:hypothetical protein